MYKVVSSHKVFVPSTDNTVELKIILNSVLFFSALY